MTPAKTILHLFSGDLWAGAEVMIFNLLTKLQVCGDLNIIALSLNEGTLTQKLRGSGIETHIIPEVIHSFPNLFLKTFTLMKDKRIDIIHAHRYKENLLAFLLSKSLRVHRVFSTLHGLSELLPENHLGETPISWKTKLDYFLLSRCFTRVAVVSGDIREALIRRYGFDENKIDVIYNGVEIPSFTTSSRSSRPAEQLFHIGTVGRMVPVKDFRLFLKIAAGIMARTNHVRFSILGDGPLRQQLIREAECLGIARNVTFLQPQTDPAPYYQSLDLYLNTSMHEGIPLSILEAMAWEKPIVAPKIGGIPEIISHQKEGHLVEGRDPNDFICACMNLIANQALRYSMGEKASKRVNTHFRNDKMAESYRALYS